MGSNQYAQLLKNMVTGVISVTGGLVVLVGGWILTSAFSSGPEYEDFALKSASVQTEREPSSVQRINMAPEFKLAKALSSETLTVGCLQDGMKLERKMTAKHVRVKAKLCNGPEVVLSASSLVNRANGFEATLFNVEGGSFTSDYISLSEGENQIYWQVENAKGQRSIGEIKIVYERPPEPKKYN